MCGSSSVSEVSEVSEALRAMIYDGQLPSNYIEKRETHKKKKQLIFYLTADQLPFGSKLPLWITSWLVNKNSEGCHEDIRKHRLYKIVPKMLGVSFHFQDGQSQIVWNHLI